MDTRLEPRAIMHHKLAETKTARPMAELFSFLLNYNAYAFCFIRMMFRAAPALNHSI